MPHKRKDIRDAIQTLLVNQTSAGDRVYINRTKLLDKVKLPAILIYIDTETAITRDIRNTSSIRTLVALIQIVASGKDDATDDTLDDVALEIETIMYANPSISAKALGATYTGTEFERDNQGESKIASASLSYEIKYIA